MRIGLICSLILMAVPALAEPVMSFQSPTGNLHCVIWQDEKGVDVRCDRANFTAAPARPADCQLDWGHAFALNATGPGYAVCAGDTVMTSGTAVLNYGQSAEWGGIRCTSERTGVTCRNAQGGGFSISRGAWRLF